MDEAERTVSLSIEAGGGRLMEAVRSLEGLEVELDDISHRRPNLDEVFLALTGRVRKDETDAARGAG
jgi:ABC-2 type transport system ATP-binding protein